MATGREQIKDKNCVDEIEYYSIDLFTYFYFMCTKSIPGTCGGPNRAPDPLVLQMVVSFQVGNRH